MSERPSMPPGDDSLRAVTERYKSTNDRHEAALAAVVTVTDAQRLVVVRELWALFYGSKLTHASDALYEFERVVRERLAAGVK